MQFGPIRLQLTNVRHSTSKNGNPLHWVRMSDVVNHDSMELMLDNADDVYNLRNYDFYNAYLMLDGDFKKFRLEAIADESFDKVDKPEAKKQ